MRAALALLLGLLPLAGQAPVPVLVELFTSEGCSSCPPADAVLARLLRHPEPGVRVVALGLHVDYWDALGWKDPFGSSAWSERQRAYAWAEGSRNLYTPQMRVEGGPAFVGSDETEARTRLRDTARRPHIAMNLQREADRLRLQRGATSEPFDLWIAWTEEGLESAVGRGENAGRRLAHATVLRSLQRHGTVPAGPAQSLDLPSLPPAGTPGHPRTLVVFLQHPKTLAVKGVASISL